MSVAKLVERTDTNVAVEVQVSSGLTGATAVVAIRDGSTLNSWLDFNDSTFKTVGWTTRQAALTEVSAGNAPGVYALSGGLDLSSLTGLPAAGGELIAEFDVSSGSFQQYAWDVFQLVDGLYDIAQAGDAMDLVTDAVDSDAVATTGANEIRDSILSDSTPFAGANIDAAISSRAAPGDAMDLVTDAVDAAAVATTGANEIRDAILSDSTPFAGANIDAAISSRAAPGDAMDLVTDAVDSAAVATTGANEIRDAILSDSTAFPGANIDAAISTRATQAQILSDATPFAGANVDATISSRATQTSVDALDAAVDGCHLSVSYDNAGTAIGATLWLERNGVTVASPTGITVTWRNEDGTSLFSHTDADAEITGPDAQGIWRLQKTQALADDEGYYVVIAITDASGTVTSTRGVPTVG